MKRGEIYYIQNNYSNSGSEIRAGRPAIVVSCDVLNATSGVLEVVFLTTQPKDETPTHVMIASTGRTSFALCEQISAVSIDRFNNYVATCTPDEMQKVDLALALSLGINEINGVAVQDATTANLREALIRAETERNVYLKLYKQLLASTAPGIKETSE